MRILITGGSGFIGSHITKELVKTGYEVIILDKISPELNEKERSKIVYINGDVLDTQLVRNILLEYDIDLIIHLVGLPVVGQCIKNPDLSFKLNALSVQSVVEAARLSSTKKIIFASTAAVYGNPKINPVSENYEPSPNNIYGYHKLIGELIVRSYSQQYGIKSVILRLFNVFGADPFRGKDVTSIFIRKILKKEKITVYDPNSFRDFIYIMDVVKIFKKIIEKIDKIFLKNEENTVVYNVGTGHYLRIIDLVNIIREVIKEDFEFEIISTENDGTGYFADITKVIKELNIIPTNSKEAFKNFVKTIFERFR